ncbi:hypothetical protein YB2330_006407 [Saitoella coloradoensis]
MSTQAATKIRTSVMVFHHIYSSKKRRAMKEWAQDANLGALCKIGKAGILVVEGPDDIVQDYVSKIKQMRWQSCHLRAERIREDDPPAPSKGKGKKEEPQPRLKDCAGYVEYDKVSELNSQMDKFGLQGLIKEALF